MQDLTRYQGKGWLIRKTLGSTKAPTQDRTVNYLKTVRKRLGGVGLFVNGIEQNTSFTTSSCFDFAFLLLTL